MQAWARERALRGGGAAGGGDGLIAAGHTATDQVETVLYRLAASPGRRALLGMPERSGRIVRPLLDMTREETAAYCRARGLPWREDSSNAASARGLIRDTILPALRQLHPAAEENMLATLAQLREEAAALDALVDAALGGEWSQKAAERPFATTAGDEAAAGGATARRGEVAGRAAQGDEAAASGADGVNVAALPPAVARLVLQRLADDAAGGAAASLATHAEAIVALAAKPGTASLDLPGGLRAISEYGRVRIERAGATAEPMPARLPIPGRVAFGDGVLVSERGPFAIADGTLAEDALAPALEVRAVASGRPDAPARARRQQVAAGPVHRPQGPARGAPPAARGALRRGDRVGARGGDGRAIPGRTGHRATGAARLAPRLRGPMSEEIGEILVQADDLQHRIRAMAEEIARDYEGKDLLLIGVLKGAFLFLADLMRHLDVGCEVDFMAVASYGSSTESSGVVRILKDLDAPLEGRHVLIVEDIVDSGLTLQYLMRTLKGRGPASLEVCALLTKPSRRTVDLPVRYTGFEIPDKFAIGYGLDYAERYRNLPYVAALVLTDD